MEWARGSVTDGAGPSYFGFVTGGVLPAALAGDWLASALDQNAATSVTSPASATTEALVIRWIVDLLHLPSSWGGVMTSGATKGNFLALAAGRQSVGRALGFDPTVDGLGDNPLIHVVTSTEVHSKAVKTLGALGLGRGTTVKFRANAEAIDLDALVARLLEHREP